MLLLNLLTYFLGNEYNWKHILDTIVFSLSYTHKYIHTDVIEKTLWMSNEDIQTRGNSNVHTMQMKFLKVRIPYLHGKS